MGLLNGIPHDSHTTVCGLGLGGPCLYVVEGCLSYESVEV